jgi:hypothetical protein
LLTAPGIGHANNTVTIDAQIGDNASGVLYALAVQAAVLPFTWTVANWFMNTI